MNHYQFISISPLTLDWRDVVRLRQATRRLWDDVRFDPALTVLKTGGGARFIEDDAFAAYAKSANFVLANAELLRRGHAYWIRCDAISPAAFDAFCAKHGVKGTLSTHVIVGRNGAVCVVAAFDFPSIAGTAPFDQRDIRSLQEQVFNDPANEAVIDAFVSGQILGRFPGKHGRRAGATRADSTHILTVLVGGDSAACNALKSVHAEEEGSAESLVETTGQSAAALNYLRFGWSYSTIVLKRYAKEIALASLMIHLQNLWFTQKTMREQLGDFKYVTAGIRKDRTLAVELEALNIERTFSHNEVEDFRANLKPWLRSAYEYVYDNWSIGDTRDSIERIVADLRAYYERKLDVFENRQSKRQANVLFWIALLQFVAIYEGVGAYFGFLQMSEVDTESMFRSALIATAVIGSPIVLLAISLYAAYLYFRDERAQGE